MNIYSEWRSLPRHFLCTALTLSGAALLAVPAPGYGRTKPGSELNILYSFCAKAECKDGKEPSTSLSFDSAGNLYGTTLTGGPRDSGVIFQISPDGKMHLLYTFCRKGDCFDGQGPAGPLIFDTSGAIYGITEGGGETGYGTVFKLTLDQVSGKWKLKTIYSFCNQRCLDGIKNDGVFPTGGLAYNGQSAGLPYDGQSPLYGTTYRGGKDVGSGTVFSILPLEKAGKREKIVLNFCDPDCETTGSNPVAGPVMDDDGNLYGATSAGGAQNHGVVYRLSPSFSESILYNFCSAENCTDGDGSGPLRLAADGKLYGFSGGGVSGSGVAYKLTRNGKQWNYSVVHSFCADGSCTDIVLPGSGPAVDADGNIFGTADGGANGYGLVFKLHGDGETVLYNFCSQANCPDGGNPWGGVTLDSASHLFGTTVIGGAHGDIYTGGTVYELIK